MLQAKQLQLREVLSGGGEGNAGPTPEERQLEQQREEYGRRGIRCAGLCTGETRFSCIIGVCKQLLATLIVYRVHLLCTGRRIEYERLPSVYAAKANPKLSFGWPT